MANYSDIKYQPAGSATTTYSDMAALIAATGMSAGDQALVTSLNKVFMYTGSAWYLVATMTNDSPTAITGVDGTYTLAIDGTATTITAVSTDPEGFALTWSYAVTSGSLGSTATVSQADNVFTVTPSTNSAHEGNFSITFSVTDGATGAVSAVSSFTLAFSVTNSRYTSLSVKATNTGSNQTFDDASTSNHTITVAGDTTASTFSPHRHGGYAINFDGSGDSLTVPDSTDFDIASDADFTLELWGFYRSFATQSHFVDTRGTSQGVFLTCSVGGGGSDDGKIKFYTNSGNRILTASTVPLNSWVHIALVRYSGTTKIYINGTADSNTYSDTNTYIALDWNIGKRSPIQTGSYMEGLFSDYRFVNGTAVYTSNFAPPTEPLTAITNTKLLLGNLPYFKDQSASNHAITVNGDASLAPKSVFDNAPYSEADHGASAYFGGFGDGINLNGDAEFAFGTNDFTVEFWLYPLTRTATEAQLVDFRGTSGNGTYTLLYLDNQYNTNNIIYYHQGGARITSSAISDNTWSHVALTRSGNDVKLFVNGIQEGSTFTNSLTQLVGTNGPKFGSYHNGAYALTGYMSDIRILNGTAAYTSNFTPPTEPLTAVTNTKFLLNPETSISDLSQSSTIKCVGDAVTDTTQVKFAGTKSIVFDGTGDYLTFDIDGDIGANEDFTVELWHRFSSDQWGGLFQVAPQILGNAHGNSIPTFAISRRTSSGRYQMYSGSGGYISAGAGQTTVGQWYHLAYVRYNGTIKIYEDGTEITALSAADTTVYTTPKGIIGGKYATGYLMYGNIQDFRFTRGLARYTSNFTPPTAELEG